MEKAKQIMARLAEKGISWHMASSKSALNIIAAVYGLWIPIGTGKGIERLAILSKGHASLALYTWLAVMGILGEEELESFSRVGSRLQAHPVAEAVPGVIASTGSLGQGLSIANGLALAGRIDGVAREVVVIMGDGELDEGQVWEAASTASSNKLDNVIVVIDRNGLQHTGPTETIKRKEPLAERWKAFGWHVVEVDNDAVKIAETLERLSQVKGKPKAVIVRKGANTS